MAIAGLVHLLIVLLILGVIALPEPFRVVVLTIIVVPVLLNLLLPMLGGGTLLR